MQKKQINKALKSKTKKELHKVYDESIKELIEKGKGDAFDNFLRVFDVISWLTAKVENRSFRSVYYDKIKAKASL